MPTISNDAASVPLTLRLFVPRPSSVTEMSARRTWLETSAASEIDGTVLRRVTAVGAWLAASLSWMVTVALAAVPTS